MHGVLRSQRAEGRVSGGGALACIRAVTQGAGLRRALSLGFHAP